VFWTELLIAESDLERLRATLPDATLRAYREWRNMTVGRAPVKSASLLAAEPAPPSPTDASGSLAQREADETPPAPPNTMTGLPRSDALPTPSMSSPPRGVRGRKKGSGEIKDELHLWAMLDLLADEQSLSLRAAAVHVIETGSVLGSSRESKIRRLGGKFSAKFGGKPDPGENWNGVRRKHHGSLIGDELRSGDTSQKSRK